MNIETPVQPSRAKFAWDDPFYLEDQLSEEERMIRDTATGKVLTGMIRRIHKEATGMAVNTPEDIDALMAKISG